MGHIMKALRFHETGDLSKLKLEEVPIPEPKSGEVLVQVKAAAINPADIKNIYGKMKEITTVPRIPGRDFAGVIAKGTKKGQAVLGSGGLIGFNRDGAQAEYVVVPEAALVPKPDSISFGAAAAMGIPYMTAWAAIVDAAQVQPNDNVLIVGATGAVGSIAAQIAKWKGAKVFGTVRHASEKGKSIDVIINLEKQGLQEALMAATQNKGVNAILDTVGGPLFEPCLNCLADHGRQVIISSMEPRVTFNLVDFYRKQLKIIGVNSLRFTLEESVSIIQNLLQLIEKGHLDLPSFKALSIDQALEAYRQIDSGQLKEKVVIQF